MILVKSIFTTFPFIYEVLPGCTMQAALLEFTQKATWIKGLSESLDSVNEVAKCIDNDEIQLVDAPTDSGFQKSDGDYPTTFKFDSEFCPVILHLCSYSQLAGQNVNNDRRLIVVRFGREYKKIHNSERLGELYETLCESFNPKCFKCMYGGPSATFSRYFSGFRHSRLGSIDHCLAGDLLPPVGILPLAKLVDSWKNVLEEFEVKSWWLVGESHVFVEAWAQWNVANEDYYKNLAKALGYPFTFYHIPVSA